MPRRKRRVSVLSGDSLKAAGLAAGKLVGLLGLVGSFLQGWDAKQKAQQATDQATHASAVADTARTVSRRSGRVDSLRREVQSLKADVAYLKRARALDRLPVYGPEPMPVGYKNPRGWLSRMLGHSN